MQIANHEISVIIIGDHDLVRTGMRCMLENIKGISVVNDIANNADTVRLVRQLAPDVILIDIKTPDMNGLETARSILRFNSRVKIIMITSGEDNFMFTHLLGIGAYGYITKDSTLEEMLDAIRAVNDNKRYICAKLAQQLVLNSADCFEKSPFEKLSIRELQVALMIVSGNKTKDIAKKLNISSKTVNTYRYRIHEKLGVTNDVRLAYLAVKHKLIEDV